MLYVEMLNSTEMTIPSGVMVHFNIQCPLEGLTINACGREGKTILYISTKTRLPGSAEYEHILILDEGKCKNVYVQCSPNMRKRQASESDPESEDIIFVGIEGAGPAEDNNVYDIEASTGDSSTPQGQKHRICRRNACTFTCTCKK